MSATGAEQRLRAIRRRLTVWAVVAGAAFALLSMSAIFAVVNGEPASGPLSVASVAALGVYVYLQVLRGRAKP